MIAENEEDWISLSLGSIIDIVDKVIIVDSGSSDNTINRAIEICSKAKVDIKIIHHRRANTKADDGEQRQAFLDYLQEHHIGDWAIVIDADEVWSGEIDKLRGLFEQTQIDCFDLKTIHLIGDLGHYDSVKPEHWTLRRMYKINKNLKYPQAEHGVLEGCDKIGRIVEITMFHFAHARHAFYWLKKRNNMKAKSEIHNNTARKWWYYNHLFGDYPRKKLDPNDLPKIIKDKFMVEGER